MEKYKGKLKEQVVKGQKERPMEENKEVGQEDGIIKSRKSTV
jgi:hypothetical protein